MLSVRVKEKGENLQLKLITLLLDNRNNLGNNILSEI